MQRGITMLEVIIVIGIFILVSGCALWFSMDSFRGSTFRGDRDTFVTVLQRARALSVSNTCIGTCSDGRPHGVAIVGDQYVLFQGASYATRDAGADSVFQANAAVARTGASEIVFAPLSGTTTTSAVFVHADGSHTSTTTVDTNGRIWWTQ